MSAVTQNELDRLRKERDLARRDYEVMNKIREDVEQDLEAALEREKQYSDRYWENRWREDQNCLAEALEREQALSRELEHEHYHRHSVQESEQALAAHVERINAHADYVGWKPGESKLANILVSGPAVSLTKRDLIKQAEALRNAAKDLGSFRGHLINTIDPEDLIEFAKSLEDKAEAHND